MTLDTAVVGTWIRNYRGGTHYWDERTQRIFGVEGDVEGQNFDDAFWAGIHADDREEVRRSLSLAENEGSGYECEFRVVRPDGEIRSVRSRGTVTNDNYGRPVQMIVACMDITDIKRAEAQLRENHERLTRLHEITSDYSRSLDDKVGLLLNLGRETFGVPIGFVARVEGRNFTVEHAAGLGQAAAAETINALANSYVADTLSNDTPLTFHEAPVTPERRQPLPDGTSVEVFLGPR